MSFAPDDRLADAIASLSAARSLPVVMTIVRDVDPLGAIGAYWATPHEASEHEMRVLQVLADTSAVVLSRAG